MNTIFNIFDTVMQEMTMCGTEEKKCVRSLTRKREAKSRGISRRVKFQLDGERQMACGTSAKHRSHRRVQPLAYSGDCDDNK